jgi:large subunit ribosomal protein L5
MSAIKDKYDKVIVPELVKEFGYTSIMQVPKISKIVVNVGCGDAVQNAKVLDKVVDEIQAITGQRPVVTKAKKSISNFKLRAGMPIGVKVTLRGEKMYYFLDKIISVVLPRVRDFRGISANAFDGRGNYTLGVKEQITFPEISIDKVDKVRGMDIVVVTTALTDDEGRALLSKFGMPFKK